MGDPGSMACEGREFEFRDAGQDWLASWHSSALAPPSGTRHGSSAVCLTSEGQVVLVSSDRGATWGFPGGRPEGEESWQETLKRELLEEACARLDDAWLLGFTRGLCLRGQEEGLVLVRAIWRATVTLFPWNPRHEITDRRLVPRCAALEEIHFPAGMRPIYERWFHEATA